MPFRFGVVTLTEAPQAFARVRIRLADGRTCRRRPAELLAPKWFDKNPALSNEDNFDQLRALRCGIARGLYLDGGADTAFGHFARHYQAQIGRGAQQGLNSLVANYGPALIDRAVLDALCRALGRSFHDVIRSNRRRHRCRPTCARTWRASTSTPSSAACSRPRTISARHTVGLVDPITAADQGERVGDGLPETLEEVVKAYGHRWFKLKVGGDIDGRHRAARAHRLACSTASKAATAPRSTATSSTTDVDGVLELWHRMRADPRLARLCRSVVVHRAADQAAGGAVAGRQRRCRRRSR